MTSYTYKQTESMTRSDAKNLIVKMLNDGHEFTDIVMQAWLNGFAFGLDSMVE